MSSDKIIIGQLETLKHIHRVRELLSIAIAELDKRAREHDLSKLESPEKEIFGEYGEELKNAVYMSDEYKKLLEKVQPAIEHHYANNRHHPQYHKDGINGMDLFDTVELLMDWLASTERVRNGNIRKSIELNKERFGMSEQLAVIFQNTINRYF